MSPWAAAGSHPAPTCLGVACAGQAVCRRLGCCRGAGGWQSSGGPSGLAGEGCDSTALFHLSDLLLFFFFNPLASLTLFYNPSLGSLKSTLVIKHVGACE